MVQYYVFHKLISIQFKNIFKPLNLKVYILLMMYYKSLVE